MKISVNKKEFVSAMADVLKVVPKKPLMPITSQGLMRLSPSKNENELGEMVIAGTDMAHMIFKSISANIQGEKKDILFDIEKTHNLCKKISGDTIVFDVTEKGLNIKSATGKYGILFLETDATLFPVLGFSKAEQKEAVILTVERNLFVDTITKLSKFVDEKGRSLIPGLHNVYMRFSADETIAFATDKDFLSKITLPIKNDKEAEIMIDFNAVKYLPLLDDQQITIAYILGKYTLVSGTTKIIGRGCDTKYPNVEKLIDGMLEELKTQSVSFEFSKEMLLDSVERLKVLSEATVPVLELILHKAEMTIRVHDAHSSSNGEETHECQVNSDNKIKVKFNIDNLMTVLSSFDNDTLSFTIKDTDKQVDVDKPVFVKHSFEGREIMSLLMPLCNI